MQVADAEFLHHGIALRLRQVAVERVCIVSVGDQLVGDLLRVAPCAAENDTVYIGVIVGDTFQGEVFVFCVAHVVDMPYIFCPLVPASDYDLLRIVHVVLGDLFDLARHGGGEKQHLALFGNLFQNGVDAVEEAHVKHFVGFVHDHGRNVVEPYGAALYEVEQTSRRSDHDVHTVFQAAYLAFDARSAIYRQDAQSGQIFGIVGQVAGYLQAEFAGGRKNKCLRLVHRQVDTLYQG